jgi:hypothetical protein
MEFNINNGDGYIDISFVQYFPVILSMISILDEKTWALLRNFLNMLLYTYL